jgi:integrase
MTIRYFLDKPNGEAETAIYLFLRSGKLTIKLRTGQYIHPRHWNTKPDKNGNHVNRKYTGHTDFNDWLDDLKKNVHQIYNQVTLGRDNVPVEEIREAVSGALVKKEPQVSSGFFDHFQTFIDYKSATMAPGTVANNKVVKGRLEDFSKDCGYKLTFERINLEFFDKFKTYLIKKKEHSDNTVWMSFATLKAFMNWALDRELHQNLTYKKFKAPQKDADTISLTEEELMKLYHADLPPGSTFDKVRDVFCFGCFTGQRYSDIANLKRSDIRGNTWHLKTIKTGAANQVPLNGFAMAILDKYKEVARPLPVMSNQKTNEYLKDLCEALEINQPITLSRRRGSERLENTQPKYKFISSHTMRRTFITLSLERGMRPEVVMRISSHSTYSSFKKYIKLSDKVAETEMNEVWQMQPVMKVVS